MENNILDSFTKGLIKERLNVYGIVVRQHGDIIARKQYREDNFVQLYSGSKTVTAMGVMFALNEGLLKLDDKVVSFFPNEELPDDSNGYLKKMNVEHLLTMTTGHETSSLDVFYYNKCDNFINLFFNAPIKYEPGTKFEYDNGATYMLSCIIQKLTGQKLRDYLMPRLFDKLDIFNPQWDSSAWDVTLGYIGLHLTTEQYSRLGQLLLNGGEWYGNQVIPYQYVDMMVKKHVDNPGYWNDIEMGSGYGYQLWMCSVPGAYRLDGLYGQFCIVFPDKDAVICVTSHQEGNQNDILRLIYNTVLKELD